MEIIRHFTATTIIVCQNKALLHLHKKQGIWLPLGGHIDPNELPEQTARREIKEESGLEVELYNPDAVIDLGDTEQLIRPMHLLLEDIHESAGPWHQHIDFIYYARSQTFNLNPGDGETENLRWLTAGEIKALDNAPQNVKENSLEALKILGEND